MNFKYYFYIITIFISCKNNYEISEFDFFITIYEKKNPQFIIKYELKEKKCYESLSLIKNYYVKGLFSPYTYAISDDYLLDYVLKTGYRFNNKWINESISFNSRCFFSQYTYCYYDGILNYFKYSSNKDRFKSWNYVAKINEHIAIFENKNKNKFMLYNFKSKTSRKINLKKIKIIKAKANLIKYNDKYNIVVHDNEIYFSKTEEKVRIYHSIITEPGTIYFKFNELNCNTLKDLRYTIYYYNCDFDKNICFILFRDSVVNTKHSNITLPKKIRILNRDDLLVVYNYKENKIIGEYKIDKNLNFNTVNYNPFFDYVLLTGSKSFNAYIYKINWKECK